MNDQVTETQAANMQEQNVLPTTTQESPQVNVVDDATLQAVLSSMSETEMNAFLEELNKTGKACKRKIFIKLFDY